MINGSERGRNPVSGKTGPRSRSFAFKLALTICALFTFVALLGLGTWQLYRLQWKQALIERVEQRVHAAPVTAPGPDRWMQITADSDEYRHVEVSGTFLYRFTTKVQALTELGSGYWLLTPLRDADGNIVFINRGFATSEIADKIIERETAVDNDCRQPATDNCERVRIVGLLRVSEPGGGFLRKNAPDAGRWYSRDIKALAAAHGLSGVAPYFIDADKASASRVSSGPSVHAVPTVQPVGGLTVISFQNNHLVYALTWYALALMVAGGFLWAAREERKSRRSDAG